MYTDPARKIVQSTTRAVQPLAGSAKKNQTPKMEIMCQGKSSQRGFLFFFSLSLVGSDYPQINKLNIFDFLISRYS